MAQPQQAETLTIEEAVQWYEQVRSAISVDRDLQVRIAQGLSTGVSYDHLLNLPVAEVISHYEALLAEHEKVCCLNLLATAEAILRADYLYRAKQKWPDAASVAFRSLYKSKSKRAQLVEDLLEVWKDATGKPTLIGELVGAFNYRNWLAHGRYWHPGLGQSYDVASLLLIIQEAFGALGPDFDWV
jgi:hypothetical protein